jgi:hypothetical protein
MRHGKGSRSAGSIKGLALRHRRVERVLFINTDGNGFVTKRTDTVVNGPPKLSKDICYPGDPVPGYKVARSSP